MEWVLGITTLLSILAGVYATYSSNKQNKELAQQQNQWNQQAATTAYERGIEQWNRETDYSTQMSKLESAGINPALAYSSGVSMPSFSAVTPAHGVTPPKMQAMDFSGLASGAQSLAQYNLQKGLNDAQIENLKANTDKQISEQKRIEKLLPKEEQHFDSQISYFNELATSQQNYRDNLDALTSLYGKQFEEIEQQINEKDQTFHLRLNNLRYDTLLKQEEFNDIQRQFNDLHRLRVSQAYQALASGALSYQQVIEVNKAIEHYDAIINKVNAETAALMKKNGFITAHEIISCVNEAAVASRELVGIYTDVATRGGTRIMKDVSGTIKHEHTRR